MSTEPQLYKKAKDRRKKAPVKRVQLSAEERRAYEELMQERQKRDKEHTQFLPEDRQTRR
ncbi:MULTISPECIES: hypothetical protein [Hyphomicrobiales]|nr:MULTISPECIES: hypothetical protein [Hyphomicrobiales]MBK1624262.1 hypothetical protein [Afifella marina DSM 2698]MBK1627995.1 hypothetical protein [Afifella marina]MBK5918189.1 hypothetical protein [Afifella marina]MCF1502555.1 hypothetical protein [Afifella sp. H1R]MCT8266165.1 hypothetical protein [Afifella sp. JA880]